MKNQTSFDTRQPVRRRRKGAILIGLVVAMVLVAGLGAVMFQLNSASVMTVATPNLSWRAYYMAESGYRFAAGQFLHAGDGLAEIAAGQARDGALQSIHSTGTFTVDAVSNFNLVVYPYYYKNQTDGAAVTSMTAAPFGAVPFDGNIASGGWILVNGQDVQYSSVLVSPTSLTFNFPTPSDVEAGSVYPVGLSNTAGLIAQGGDFSIQTSSGLDLFPPKNGMFRVDGKTGHFFYKTRDLANNRLEGVIYATGAPLNLVNGDKIVLERSVRMVSTGNVGQGGGMVSRTIDYHFGLVAGDESGAGGEAAPEYVDSDMENWDDSRGRGWGDFEIASVDGDDALHVVDAPGGSAHSASERSGSPSQEAFVGASISNFEQAWTNSNKFLSYDAQVKIKVSDEDYYLEGISFRVNAIGTGAMDYLAVSLMRSTSARNTEDGIPDTLLEGVTAGRDNQAMIVLWKLTGHGNNSRIPLAFLPLTAASGVVDDNGRLSDWSTLLVRIEEKEENGARFNDVKVYYATRDENGAPGTSITDNGRLGYPRSESIEWPVEESDITETNDFFTQVVWTGVDASVTASEGNTVVRITGFLTDFETWPTGRPELGLHAYGEDYGSAYFDDLAIRFPSSGASNPAPPPGFQEPIQG